MADKDIKIGITTSADTSGAKAAEQALNAVEKAGEQAASSNPMLRGKAEYDAQKAATLEAAEATEAQAAAMKKAAQAEAELAEGLGELKEATDDYVQSAGEATEQTGELDENVANIARAQKAQAVADLAGKVGLIGTKFKEAAAEVRGFDAEAADKLEATGERIEKVTGAVSQLALGFAVGGPLGAGVAAIGILVGGLMDVWKETEIAAAKAAAVQKEGMADVAQATREARAAEEQRQAVMAADTVLKTLSDELAALEKISAEKRIQTGLEREKRRLENEVLQAEDKAALAGVDEAQAQGKITGPQAEQKRAEIEIAASKRARDARKADALEEARIAEEDARTKEETARKAVAAEEELFRQREEQAAKAKGLVDYYQHEDSKMVPGDKDNASFLDDITAEIDTARKVLADIEKRRQEAEQKAKAAVESAQTASLDAAAKKESAGLEVSAVDRIGAAEDKAFGSRRGVQDAKAQQSRKREEADIGNDAARLIPKEASAALRDSITKVAKGLQDGDQGEEIKQLAELMERLASVVQGKGAKAEIDFKNLSERIRRLEGK